MLNFSSIIILYSIKLLSVEQASFKTFQLNDEAEHIVQNGSHEAVVFRAIPDEGILQASLMVSHDLDLSLL